MTTLPAPKPPIELATGSPDVINLMLDFHHAGVLALPVGLVDCVRSADTLQRAARDVAAGVNRQDPSAVRRVILDALKTAAAEGRLPADAGAEAAASIRDLAALDARSAVLRDAASESAHELRAAILSGARGLGDLLAGALTRVLAEAAAPARGMRDAGPSAWSNPAALLDAETAVQDAYRVLVPLATLHDRLRGAAVALATYAPDWMGLGTVEATFAARQRAAVPGADPEWRRCSTLAGYGVEQDLRYSRDRPWVFRPVGHPVQRLVAAATDPAPEPIAEPTAGADPTDAAAFAPYRLAAKV